MPPQLDWLLHRSLGPVDQAAALVTGLATDDPALRHLANDLWGRLSLRVPAAELRRALGDDVVGQKTNRWGIAARMLRHQEVCRRLGELAAGLGTPILFIKGLALHLGGHAPPGTRHALDVDVLVEPSAAARVYDELLAVGGQASDQRPGHRHLPPIRHPLGSDVEIHVELPGVSLDGRPRNATLDQIIAAGLTGPIEGLSSACHLPERDLLAAHLLAHAIGQHGAAPHGYAMLRLFTDLQDLGFGAQQPIPERVIDWCAISVSRQEVVAVEQLLGRFEEGARASQILTEGRTGPALLLGHVLAGMLDEDYRRSLKLAGMWRDDAGRRASLPELGRRVVNALVPTRGQLDVIYGQPSSRAGYLFLRLARPFDLALRLARSALARRRVRRR